MALVLMPTPVKSWVRSKIKGAAFSGALPVTVMKYVPFDNGAESFVIRKSPLTGQELCELGLPIPPEELWRGYRSKEEYLALGKKHVSRMLDIAKASGFSFGNGQRVLDFGCRAGRMLRYLKDFADTCEIWGCDIDAEYIYWCKQHLDPPFHFFTSTTIPHLPFEDGYFDFVYAGSVFTHIDDLAEAWLLELRRILSTRGGLYLTVQDDRSLELLHTAYSDTPLADVLHSSELYKRSEGSFAMLSIGRDSRSRVFYDSSYFRKTVASVFDVLSVTEEAADYQTAVLLAKKSVRVKGGGRG